MNTWFLSDPHFGHKNILKYESIHRPFKDTNEMDEAIIDNYNRTVNEGDLVFWLGDMFFCNSARMDYIVSRLIPTRNILIRGNHDKGMSDTKFRKLGFEPHRMYLYDDLFLTHEPLPKENFSLMWNHMWKQYEIPIKNVHGHTHSDETGLFAMNYQCVSLEMIGMKPISEEDLRSKFANWRI